MKIECKEPDFEPIILTIESQMELDVLSDFAAMGREVEGTPDEVSLFLSKLADGLDREGADPSYKYFCGFESKLQPK